VLHKYIRGAPQQWSYILTICRWFRRTPGERERHVGRNSDRAFPTNSQKHSPPLVLGDPPEVHQWRAPKKPLPKGAKWPPPSTHGNKRGNLFFPGNNLGRPNLIGLLWPKPEHHGKQNPLGILVT